MKILILGAGATGGYFGGRLAAAGADVTFLVRSRRAEQLAREGLVIESPYGNWSGAVATVTGPSAGARVVPVEMESENDPSSLRGRASIGKTASHFSRKHSSYDLVVLSCKAYDLEPAIEAVRPFMGPTTQLLPLLNGLNHLDALDAAFGPEHVLGGLCHISATLSGEGHVRHLNRLQLLTFGQRFDDQRAFCAKLLPELQRGGFGPVLSDTVMQALWEKFVLLTTLAGMTVPMRATIGEIVATADGRALMLEMLDECAGVAAASGHAPRLAQFETMRTALTDPASPVSASMRRDLEQGGRIEADHIVGDMLRRAREAGHTAPLLRTAYCHLQCYQNRLAHAISATS